MGIMGRMSKDVLAPNKVMPMNAFPIGLMTSSTRLIWTIFPLLLFAAEIDVAHSTSEPRMIRGAAKATSSLHQGTQETCRSIGQERFHRLDQDRDNALSIEDLKLLGLKLTLISGWAPFSGDNKGTVARRFQAMDVNHDQQIDLNEFLFGHCRLTAATDTNSTSMPGGGATNYSTQSSAQQPQGGR